MLLSGVDVSAITELSEKTHSHMSGELLYMLEGEAFVRVSGDTRHLSGGDVLWIDSGVAHSVELAAETMPLLCRAQLSMQALSLGPQVPRIWCDSQADPDSNSFNTLRDTLTDILYLDRQASAYYASVSLRYHLLDQLLSHHCAPEETSGAQYSVIHLVTQYIEQHFDEPISLQSTAAALHYSEPYLSRLIRKKLATTFSEYLQDVRLRHAAELLTHTQKQITTIAYECGFSSPSALSRQFLKKYGASPSTWRAAQPLSSEQDLESSERLLKYFGILESRTIKQADSLCVIHADFRRQVGHTEQIWASTVNLGPLAGFFACHSKNGVMEALADLETRRVRFCSIFEPRIMAGQTGDRQSFRFSQEFSDFLYMLSKNGLAPFFRIESWRVLCADPTARHPALRTREDHLSALRSLLLHLSSFNYHYSQLTGWFFELWEPDCTFLDDEYFETYDYLRAAAKELLPGVRIGGSGARFGSRNGQQSLIVDRWRSRAGDTDFLSFSFFPYSVDEKQQHYISDPDILPKELDLLRSELNGRGFSQLPVYITEWDAFCTENNYFNDSTWRGCYFAKAFADTAGKLDMLVSSFFIDPPSSSRPASPLRGGPGTLTDTMLKKPVYQVLRSFRTIESGLLSVEPGCVISGNGSQRAQIILYNYRHFNALFYTKNETDFEPEYLRRYLEKPLVRQFHIEMENVDDGTYQVEIYRCNKEYASPLDQWIRKGCFDYTGKYHLLHLMLDQHVNAMVYSTSSKDHKLCFDIQVEPLEFVSINVMKSPQRHPPADTAAGILFSP